VTLGRDWPCGSSPALRYAWIGVGACSIRALFLQVVLCSEHYDP